MTTRHILHAFNTFDAAGAQVRTAALMRRFGAVYRHTVVSKDGRTGAMDLVGNADVQVTDYAPGSGPGSVMRFFRQLIRRQQPDLLLSYNWGSIDAVIAARSLGMRQLVHHEDGFNADEALRLKARRNWARRVLFHDIDLIVPSRQLERIAQDIWRLRRLHFIPNGIRARDFHRDESIGAEFRASLGIPADAIVVGAVGHLRKVKNFGRLLSAVSRIDNLPLHLVIAGDGAERAALVNLAGATTDKVHFTGHLKDLRAAYSGFDIFSLSSDSEQQPVSLLEAMSAGLPVCATDVGDVKSSLPARQHDLIFPLGPAVTAAMADGLTRLARDPGLRRTLGAGNLQHVEQHYSEEAMLGAYEKVYKAAQSR